TQMLTHTVPLTVPPLVGLVMKTFNAPPAAGGGGGGGAAPPLATLSAIDAEPVLPVASRALAVSVWGPSATADVVHDIDTGPVLDVVIVATVCDPTLSVQVFEPPDAPLSQSVTQLVPLTVAPLVGLVTYTPSVPVAGGGEGGDGCDGGGGGGAGAPPPPLLTLTFTVVVALLPDASRTVAVSGCVPLATTRVSYGIEIGPRLDVVVLPIAWPPSVSGNVLDAAFEPPTHITPHGTAPTVAAL